MFDIEGFPRKSSKDDMKPCTMDHARTQKEKDILDVLLNKKRQLMYCIDNDEFAVLGHENSKY